MLLLHVAVAALVSQWSWCLLARHAFRVHGLGLGHLVGIIATDIHMTILIIDEVDILTLLIITQGTGMTVDADLTHLNIAVVVIMTTTLPRIAVDGEGRMVTTCDRHHHDEARDIEMTIAAVCAATDTPIQPLPHVQKKETDAGETITPLVADGQVMKKTPTPDAPVMTKAITHGLTEPPLNFQKRMHLVMAITHLVVVITHLVVAITHLVLVITHLVLVITHLVVSITHLVMAITYLVMASLVLQDLRIVHGHQLSSGLIHQSERTLDHIPAD